MERPLDCRAVPHRANKATLVPNEEAKGFCQIRIHIPILPCESGDGMRPVSKANAE